MSAALAYEARVRTELPRILRQIREPAKVIAFKAGCSPRTIEAIRQNEHGPSLGVFMALAAAYPEIRPLLKELTGETDRDPARIIDEIRKMVSR